MSASIAGADYEGLPPGPRRWVMLCMIMGVVLANLDAAIANIALPTIARQLHATNAATVWVVNSYQLAAAVSLLPSASLGEILGAKRVYAFGLAVFLVASLACALSPNLNFLIGARLLQGIGGAGVAALGPALVREIYPRRIIGSGFALIALMVAIAAACGPTIAALILAVANWPWLFLVNVPICLVALPLFMAVAPKSAPQPRAFDITGAVLNTAALGLIVIGIGRLGASHPAFAVAEIAVGFAAFIILVFQQRRQPAPLLPLDLLRIPVFSLSVVTSICSYSAQILAYVSLPFLFETVMHRSQIATGFLVTPWPLMVAVAAPIAGRLSARYPASILGSIGLALLAIGMVTLATLPAAPADWNVAWRMGLCGIGFGFFQTPNNTALMTSGPPARGGSASGMVAVARTIGLALGAAMVAVLFAIAGDHGPRLCLDTGVAFAVLGLLVSGSRLFGQEAAVPIPRT